MNKATTQAAHSRSRRHVLVIAGSDPSGGAGLQGDIATLSHLGLCPLAVPSALTVQGPRGVRAVVAVPAKITRDAIRLALCEYPIKAVKIGMLHKVETLRAVAEVLRDFSGPVVLDPVLRPSRGRSLSTERLPQAMLHELWPLVDVVTPNVPEAQKLCGLRLKTPEMRIAAAQALQSLGCGALLLKGGHASDVQALDVLVEASGLSFLSGPRRHSRRTHGTGCALSSAIAAGLARGLTVKNACLFARRALDAALRHDHLLGLGGGAVAHAAMPKGSTAISLQQA